VISREREPRSRPATKSATLAIACVDKASATVSSNSARSGRTGQGRRQYGSAGVMHRADVGVVQVTGVGVGAIDEGRAGGVQVIAAQQDGAAALSSQLQGEPPRSPAPWHSHAHRHDPQEIEDERFHPVDYRVRRVLQPETRGPLGQNGRRSLTRVSRHSRLSFNHRVCAHRNRLWNPDAERLSGFTPPDSRDRRTDAKARCADSRAIGAGYSGLICTLRNFTTPPPYCSAIGPLACLLS